MLTLVQPSPQLRPYVSGYLCVRDIDGAHRGRPIETAPRPGAVLTANVGRPNSTAQGEPTPALSLLGLQTRARSWRSGADTYFAMALLTPSGLARLMPGCGSGTADALIDFGGAVGDRAARAILEDAAARPDGTGIAAALDDWLLARLTAGAASRSVDLFDAACRELSRGSRVAATAKTLGVTRRHLSRLVTEYLGIGPKALLDLHRLGRSLRAVQAGTGDGAEGFSDQAHQIREWRRRLGKTPGRYAVERRSKLAEAFDPAVLQPAFYL